MIYAGLDVSKDTVDVCLLVKDGKSDFFQISNDANGWQRLIKMLKRYRQSFHFCCEYTGIYYFGLATALHNAGYIVSVINPAIIRYYTLQEMARNKTDRQDALLIAKYCKEKQPPEWQPPSGQSQRIRILNKRVEQLTKMRTMEINRLKIAQDEDKATHESLITYLETEILKHHEKLQELVNMDEKLQEMKQLMTSIPGIGDQTATAFLSLVTDIDRFPSAKHFVSYLGLSPMQAQSGTSVKRRTRISKMGDRYMRKLLYMPARSACLRSKVFKDWAQTHMQNGKHPKSVYVMMMRKLATYIYKVIKTNQPFDKNIALGGCI